MGKGKKPSLLTSRMGSNWSTSSVKSPWWPTLRIVWCPKTIFHVAFDEPKASTSLYNHRAPHQHFHMNTNMNICMHMFYCYRQLRLQLLRPWSKTPPIKSLSLIRAPILINEWCCVNEEHIDWGIAWCSTCMHKYICMYKFSPNTHGKLLTV
mgnify:CR=1 FL=1